MAVFVKEKIKKIRTGKIQPLRVEFATLNLKEIFMK